MKIEINKEAVKKRQSKLVEGIIERAVEVAAEGKEKFAFKIEPDELNGLDCEEIISELNKKSDDTVIFDRKFDIDTVIAYLKIIE